MLFFWGGCSNSSCSAGWLCVLSVRVHGVCSCQPAGMPHTHTRRPRQEWLHSGLHHQLPDTPADCQDGCAGLNPSLTLKHSCTSPLLPAGGCRAADSGHRSRPCSCAAGRLLYAHKGAGPAGSAGDDGITGRAAGTAGTEQPPGGRGGNGQITTVSCLWRVLTGEFSECGCLACTGLED